MRLDHEGLHTPCFNRRIVPRDNAGKKYFNAGPVVLSVLVFSEDNSSNVSPLVPVLLFSFLIMLLSF